MTKQLFYVFLAALLLQPFTALAEMPTLRVCYEAAELQPYFQGKDEVPANNPGQVIEQLLLPAAATAGLQIKLYRRPWNRCINDMQHNLTDAILPAAWTAERESWGRFPGFERNQAGPADPVYAFWRANFSIITMRTSPLEWDGVSLQHLQHGIGAPLGNLANQRLEQLGALQRSNIKPETALKMVIHQRLDGYVLEELIGQVFIRKAGLQEQLRTLQPPLLQTDWYVPVTHAFYAAQPERVWRFWEALVQQRQQLEPQLQQQLKAQALGSTPPQAD